MRVLKVGTFVWLKCVHLWLETKMIVFWFVSDHCRRPLSIFSDSCSKHAPTKSWVGTRPGPRRAKFFCRKVGWERVPTKRWVGTRPDPRCAKFICRKVGWEHVPTKIEWERVPAHTEQNSSVEKFGTWIGTALGGLWALVERLRLLLGASWGGLGSLWESAGSAKGYPGCLEETRRRRKVKKKRNRSRQIKIKKWRLRFRFFRKRKTALAFEQKGENGSVLGGLGCSLGRPWEAQEAKRLS